MAGNTTFPSFEIVPVAKSHARHPIPLQALPLLGSLTAKSDAAGQTVQAVLPSITTLEAETMADDTTKRGNPDRVRINVNQDYEVRDWAKTLGVDEHVLRNAESVVGDNAQKVREFLRHWQRKGPHRAG